MTNKLKATKRDSKTAGELSSLRSKGYIPAILYGGDNPNLKISVDEKLLNKVLIQSHFFRQ
jgi:Ribosomal protein L25 (general stress protein Ctc)